jgi:transposase
MDLSPAPASSTEDAVTIDRRSARDSRVEVITRGERRRSWTAAQKREIVAESLSGELTPTEVARKHGIGSGLLYTWRQQFLGDGLGLMARSSPSFAQVEIAPVPLQAERPSPQQDRAVQPPTPEAPPRPGGVIEIVLPGGVVLRVDAEVDGRALRRVLAALEGR